LNQVMPPPVPDPIIAAAAHHHPPTPPEHRPTARGALAVVAGGAVTRIVCVTDVTDTHLVAVLCSNETDMATDHDVVVHRPDTYDLLLEAECYLVVLAEQVRAIVGTVDLDAVNAIRSSLHTDGASVAALHHQHGYTIGLPLGGLDDPRRTFMERELDDVIALRDRAHRRLFGDGWNPGRAAPHTEPDAPPG
jgi:hypothetical protein